MSEHVSIHDPYELYELYQFIADEPAICKHFGCGKTLCLEERLFGNYCVNHQPVFIVDPAVGMVEDDAGTGAL